MKQYYTVDEIQEEIHVLKRSFDVVRIIHPFQRVEVVIQEGKRCSDIELQCFNSLGCKGVCRDCMAISCYLEQREYSKFEIYGTTVYFYITRYIEVNRIPYVLEMVKFIQQNQLEEVSSNGDFVRRILHYDREVYTDPITGICNRKYICEKLPSVFEEIRNKNIPVGIGMLDIDYFKGLNDQNGHRFGDEVLREIANTAYGIINRGRGDLFARYGGDEFMLFLQDIEYDDYINKMMLFEEKMNEIMIRYGEIEIPVTVSIGVAHSGEFEKPTLTKMIDLADQRLYSAKSKGRGRLIFRS